MSLWDELKAIPVKERTVNVAGKELLVREPMQIEKHEMMERSQTAGKLDNAKLEGEVLATCVYDPQTREKLQPKASEWNLPSHIVGPLVAACIDVCGFDNTEVQVLEKK